MENPFKKPLLTFTHTLLALVIGVTVISCGGSSGGGAPAVGSASTLSGTAATGVALDGAVIVYGRNGGQTFAVETDALGNYSVDVSGLTPPFFISAIPSNGALPVQYSYSNSAGIANITPLTTLTMFYANGQKNPASLVVDWPSVATTVISNTANAQALVNANFVGIFSAISAALNIDFTTYDFNKTAFSIGDKIDQILDLLTVDVTLDGFPVVTVNGAAFTFDSSVDTSGVDIGGALGSSTGDSGDNSDTSVATGMLAISGPGTTLLSAGGNDFAAVTIVDESELNDGGVSIFWINKESILMDQVTSVLVLINVQNQVIAVQVGYRQQVGVGSELIKWFESDLFNGVPGATFDGTSVTFVDVALPPSDDSDVITTLPLVINGQLGSVSN